MERENIPEGECGMKETLENIKGMLKDNSCWIETRRDREIVQMLVDDIDSLDEIYKTTMKQSGQIGLNLLKEKDELNNLIAELETENAALKESQRWIPVSERLPEVVDINAGSHKTYEIAYRHIGSAEHYQFISYGYLSIYGWMMYIVLDEKLDPEMYEVTYWKERTYPQGVEEIPEVDIFWQPPIETEGNHGT